MKKRFSAILLSVILLCVFASQAVFSSEILNIGAIPDQNPEHLNRLYSLLSKELSDDLGIKVRYRPVTNYPAAVSAFRTGSLDLVWFGGLTGVQARLQRPGSVVIAQRDIDAEFHSVFIANKESGLKYLEDQKGLTSLKGRRFTFGSESSTSGRLMPQYYLQEVGVQTSDLHGGMPGFSGSHDATLALVQSGAYEVGALNEQVWLRNLAEGKVDESKVHVIWRTPAYVDYHWLAQPDLDQRFGRNFTERLQEKLLSLRRDSNIQSEILDMFGAEKFIPADASMYSQIEMIGRQLGKIR